MSMVLQCIFCRESVVQRCTLKRVFLSRSEACIFIKKETLAQVFSCEFCKISKSTFFHRTPLVGASVCTACKVFEINITWMINSSLLKLFSVWNFHNEKVVFCLVSLGTWKHDCVMNKRDIFSFLLLVTEATTRGVLFKKVFLEISQNSQENTCEESLF